MKLLQKLGENKDAKIIVRVREYIYVRRCPHGLILELTPLFLSTINSILLYNCDTAKLVYGEKPKLHASAALFLTILDGSVANSPSYT